MKSFKRAALSARSVFAEEVVVPPAPLTTEAVNTMINGALTRFAKDTLPNVVKDANAPVMAQFSSITELIGGLTAKLTPTEVVVPPTVKDGNSTVVIPPELNARLQGLTGEVTTLKTTLKVEQDARKAAEDAARTTAKESAIRRVLGDYAYQTPDAAEDAFQLIKDQVQLDDTGAYIAGNLPLGDFCRNLLTGPKSYLLAPSGRGGAGAAAGQNRGSAVVKPFDMNDIKPKMSDADSNKAITAIINALDVDRSRY